MPKPPEQKRTQRGKNLGVKQQLIAEVVRSFLTNAQGAFQNVACLHCGSTSDLKKITASIFESTEMWEISLPLCNRCASRGEAATASSQYGSGGNALMRSDPAHPSRMITKSLVSEMDTIHSANAMYWARGAAVTLDARTEYHRRLDRLEKIRAVLKNAVSLKKSCGNCSPLGSATMRNEKWEELYMLAAKEVDARKMPERVNAAREAIRRRLQDLQGDADHHEERVHLKDSLGKLDVLQAEAQMW